MNQENVSIGVKEQQMSVHDSGAIDRSQLPRQDVQQEQQPPHHDAPDTKSQQQFTEITMTSNPASNMTDKLQPSKDISSSSQNVGITMPPQQQQQQPNPEQAQQQMKVQSYPPPIRPLLEGEPTGSLVLNDIPSLGVNQDNASLSPQKTAITKVTLQDELNVFYWTKTKEIISQIAERAKSSVDTVITTLDPGMKEYLYSGGNVNIIVLTDSDCLVSPIRDSFQSAFGRATVKLAPSLSSNGNNQYPIRLACGLQEAEIVAQERIKKLRQDVSSVPQNQVVVVVQPTLIRLGDVIYDSAGENNTNNAPTWYSTYCVVIVDPVLNVTMKCFSQLIPIDTETVESAKKADSSSNLPNKNLGFSSSLDELMTYRLRIDPMGGFGDEYGCFWLREWAGVYETQIIHQVSLTLANAYRRKWNDCTVIETAP